MWRESVLLLFLVTSADAGIAPKKATYFPIGCLRIFQRYDEKEVSASSISFKRFTVDDVRPELERNWALLSDGKTIGRIELGEAGDWRAIAFRVRDSEIIRREPPRRRPFNSLEFYIPVRSAKEGKQIATMLYQEAARKSGTHEMFPPIAMASVRRIGDKTSSPLDPSLPDDIPPLFSLSEGYILRVSMERMGAVSAPDFMELLADEGKLELAKTAP
jgi:hypothetical protein